MSRQDWRLFGRLHTRLYKRLGGRFVDSVGRGPPNPSPPSHPRRTHPTLAQSRVLQPPLAQLA
jgi:hypothetical protein